ncbi:hypothetical protein D6851_07515 [Altericroceibacterium spongiae]|uniref:Aspartyl protease n=1 Tax=Altericroceibacterium spongiae TaxID=2320269 RepID=A0A420EML8_9SPHN|nr:hypothetical protein [Altericroceibacterium spongiae]RKF21854.1 hypothetical protein D6851_07515 [Altericroceibacterium spongiae]
MGRFQLTFYKKDYAPIAFESVNGLVLFQAKVGDRDIWVLLDNQSSSLIDTGLARELDLPFDKNFRSETKTYESSEITLVTDVPLKVNHQFTSTGGMLSISLDRYSKMLGRNIGMVLGKNYLSKISYFIDRKHEKIGFALSGAIRPKQGRNSYTLPLAAGDVIEADVNGKTMRLKIGLANSSTVRLSADSWDKAIPDKAKEQAIPQVDPMGNLGTKQWSENLPVTLDKMTLHIPISTEFKDFPDYDGIIGMGILRGFTLSIDSPAKQIFLMPQLEKHGGQNSPEEGQKRP